MQERFSDIRHTDMPPDMFLIQVTNHCPEAASLYIQLWKKRDKSNNVTVLRCDIRMEYLETKTKFINKLMLLAKEALINVYETPKSIKIELVGWDQIEAV